MKFIVFPPSGGSAPPEIADQEEVRQIVTLAAWVVYERDFLAMLTEAGCNSREAQVCMTGEVS